MVALLLVGCRVAHQCTITYFKGEYIKNRKAFHKFFSFTFNRRSYKYISEMIIGGFRELALVSVYCTVLKYSNPSSMSEDDCTLNTG